MIEATLNVPPQNINNPDNLLENSNLTQSQFSIWLGQQLNPGTPLYSMIRTFSVSGPIEVSSFQQAFQALINRSDAMRTIIGEMDGVPHQRVLSEFVYTLDFFDFSTEQNPEIAYQIWETERKLRYLNLGGCLFDSALIKLASDHHIWYLNRHHIITDGASTALIYQQVNQLYQQALAGQLDNLEPLPAFQDYVVFERDFRHSKKYQKVEKYWQEKLATPPEPLRFYGQLLAKNESDIQRVDFDLGPERTQKLREITTEKGVQALTPELSIFNIFSTLLFVYLHKISGNTHLAIGTPFNNRPSAAFKKTIGILMEMCLLQMEIDEDDTFLSLLKQGLKECFSTFRHTQPGTGSLVSNKTYEVMLNYITAPFTEFNGFPTEYNWIHSGYGDSNHGLRMQVHDFRGADSIKLQFDFNCSVFSDQQQIWAIEHFLQLFDHLLEDREQKISEIGLLTAQEKDLLLNDFNKTTATYTLDQTLIDHFEAQALQYPDNIALQYDAEQLSYHQLNKRANQLAHHLLSLGLQPEMLVGICMERSVEMAVTILGILKAGGAYVPLDPSFPQTRLQYMIEDTQLPFLMTQSEIKDNLPTSDADIICVDRLWADISQLSIENPARSTTPDSLIYVMYTSGSTGKPKGVMLRHRGLANRVLWAKETLDITPNDNVLQKASFSFDASVWEFFLPLISGARLVMARPGAQKDNVYLMELMKQEQITVIHFIPSLLQLFMAEPNFADACSSLRYIWCGGEVLPLSLLQRFYDACSGPKIVNGYGPTEGSINATYEICEADYESGTVPIGRALSNVQVHILDGVGQLAPIGVAGELHIGGVGVAAGYLNKPELTAERFIANPFSDDPTARLYKTGDLARYRTDGRIEFLGRVDHQVKIRGIRIELGEIEATLRRQKAVKETVVVAHTDADGDQKLVSYIIPSVSGKQPNTVDLRNSLKNDLPEYMVPNLFMFLDKFPLTPAGKLNRLALPLPEQSRPELNESFVAPTTASEEQLATIWQNVLGVEKVGTQDNFFDLGGHSLSVIKVMVQAREILDVNLSLQQFFETPTVAELAAIVESSTPENKIVEQSISKRPADAINRLSFAQERLWFLDQLEPGSAAYNIHGAVRLEGELDVAALEVSLNTVVQRHDILRTTFDVQDGETVQVIEPHLNLTLPIIDLLDVPAAEREAQAQQHIIEAAQAPFDLNQDVLLRLKLLKVDDKTHLIVLILHHIISDEWSSEIFWRELAALYEAQLNQTKPTLPDLTIQYTDYAHWQRENFSSESQAKELTYWTEQLDNLEPLLQLPTDFVRPRQQRFKGTLVSRSISGELAAKLQTLNTQTETTMFMTLLAVFATQLYRYTHQTDIVIGSPIANRNRSESKDLIGLFLNTLALRTDLADNPSFAELLKQVRQTALDAYAHQNMPFEKLVEELKVERNTAFNPIFQVMFVYQQKSEGLPDFPGLTLSRMPLVDSGTAKFDLTLFVHEDHDGLQVAFEYNSDLFKAETVERMLGHYQTLLENIVDNPQQTVGELPLLTSPETQQMLVDWNKTDAEFPQEATIHQLIEVHSENTPDAIALKFGDERLSYAEFNQRAEILAAYLQNQNVGPNVFVAICMERSIEMFVSILAVLKAGGAYVPLDPSYPAERLSFVLADTQAPVLLTQAKVLPNIPESEATTICVDRDWDAIATIDTSNLTQQTQPSDLAYVIYTSGSTGKPKGVPITHRNLVHSTTARLNYYPERIESFLLLSSFAFDSSIVGIFGTLCEGGTLVLPPQGGEQEIQSIASLIAQHQASHLLALPSLYNLLLQYAQAEQLKSLRVVMVAGEACPKNLIALHYQQLPKATLYNEYGPTEGTVWSTVYRIPVDESHNQVPIGRPIANMQTYILNEQRQPLPIGVPGELYIGGVGLAEGYLNRPELTAEKFVPHPFCEDRDCRLYRTGDLVRYLPDGNIEFLGRVDNQVKIRGYRIELDEIGEAMRQHPAIQDAVVIVAGEEANKQLVGYLAGEVTALPSSAELKEFLQDRLPDYMVPLIFVPLPALPLTPNGKVDRRALPQPNLSELMADADTLARDVLEFQLTRIWEDVLKLERVGVHDNFFELGGQSLLAVRLINEIEQQIGQELPLAALFQAPTISQLAEILRNEGWDISQNSLVTIQAGEQDEKAPLYLVPGNLGNVFTDLGLVARHLTPDQPLYGLQDGVNIPSQVKAMAAHYIKEIQAVQAEGPYFLGGICSGGVVAYEMAQQLHDQGEEVGMLALVEAFPHENRLKSVWSLFQRIAGRFFGGNDDEADENETEVVESAEAADEGEGKSLKERVEFLRLKAKVVTNMLSVTRYNLKPYNGPIDIYMCEESFDSPYKPHLSWQRVAAGGIEMHQIPGTHNDITGDHGFDISEEVMADLARQLTARMAETTSK